MCHHHRRTASLHVHQQDRLNTFLETVSEESSRNLSQCYMDKHFLFHKFHVSSNSACRHKAQTKKSFIAKDWMINGASINWNENEYGELSGE